MSGFDHDVAIIGAGPSGIAAATALSQAGVKNIVVYEREAKIGGIPRHTHHPSFGLLVFKRPMSGPRFIAALRARCPEVRFVTGASLIALRPGGGLEIATASGLRTIHARHIILATGARETPRHPRLVSGLRPQGVMTTGALQQFIYQTGYKPFASPVIVGTELVSFSALWSLRHVGIKPAAMIEVGPRITAYRPAALLARLLRVPIHYNSELSEIDGSDQVSRVLVSTPNSADVDIACDGVIFTGQFTGENTIARASHLALSPVSGLPLVDQNWISSDPAISVIGNATHPADMGDLCYLEGLRAGAHVAAVLAAPDPQRATIAIRHGIGIKMTTPNMVRSNATDKTCFNIAFQVTKPYSGVIQITCAGQVLYQKTRRCRPTRRITLKNIRLDLSQIAAGQEIEIRLGRSRS